MNIADEKGWEAKKEAAKKKENATVKEANAASSFTCCLYEWCLDIELVMCCHKKHSFSFKAVCALSAVQYFRRQKKSEKKC